MNEIIKINCMVVQLGKTAGKAFSDEKQLK